MQWISSNRPEVLWFISIEFVLCSTVARTTTPVPSLCLSSTDDELGYICTHLTTGVIMKYEDHAPIVTRLLRVN